MLHCAASWRVDETYVRLGGAWKYLFEWSKIGRLIDFMLSDRRSTGAARCILGKALKTMRDWPPLHAVLTSDIKPLIQLSCRISE